jgi:hypothetical protein
MFYEQMLDLATELADRGFPEFNIFKALVALGCPHPLAKLVATVAAGNQRSTQQAGNSSTDAKAEPTAPENITELVVKSKRHLAIFAALFGLWIIYQFIDSWGVPIGGGGWSGLEIWQYFFRFAGGPFGVLMLISYGQISISNTLMVVDRQGIRLKWTPESRQF